MLACTQKMVSR